MPDALPPLTVEQYEQLDPVATFRRGARELRFATPSRVTLWRVQTILEKEPETIRWIESFEPGAVMVDVGANVGMYTIWAAALAGATVHAFEPEAQNYALLCRNLALNGLSRTATAWCLALSDAPGFADLHVSALGAGRSCHSYGEALNSDLEPQAFPFRQGCAAAALDRLVADGVVAQPHHIKIDVDGLEHRVVAGARAALAHPDCRSVLVEINTRLARHRAIADLLQSLGYAHDPAETAAAMRTEGRFAGTANHVFRR